MKKWLIFAVILILTMAVTGTTVLAASASFSDVPATHWAYGAVNKLVQAGIINNYTDGAFRGDKPITRYEFAIATTKALENYDRADVANKQLIDKLSIEFATELNTLGTRVTKVENKVANAEKKLGTFKFNGDFRIRYENVNNPTQLVAWPGGVGVRGTSNGAGGAADGSKVVTRDRVRLFVTNDIADNLTLFTDFIWSGNASGSFRSPVVTSTSGGYAANPNNLSAGIEASFLTYKAQDGTVYKFGRNFLYLGQGMLWDVPYADGLQVTFGNDALRTMIGTQQFISQDWYFADMKYKANDHLTFTLAHIQDKNKLWYNSTALGFTYKGIPNWTFSSEYGENNNALVNQGRDHNPKASIITIKNGEAKRDVIGSTGAWVSYKKGQKGFDTQFASTWDYPNPYPSGMADDIKGYEYGFEYTAFKNGIVQIKYDPLKSYDGSRDLKFMIAQLVVRY